MIVSLNQQFLSEFQVFSRPKWTAWIWILTIFKCKNEYDQQLAQKVDGKRWSHWSSFHVSCIMVLKLHFLQFCTAVSKKFKSVVAVFVYALESSHFIFAENGTVIKTYCFWDIRIWSWRILLNFFWVSTFLIFLSSRSCKLWF